MNPPMTNSLALTVMNSPPCSKPCRNISMIMIKQATKSEQTDTDWGQGDLETSGNMLGKLQALDHFSPL